MTQNLRLGDGTKTYTLTPADSDVSANWTLPIAQTSGNVSWGNAANTSNTPHLYATGNDSYGNYYNWYAATAGTGLGTMSSASATNFTNAISSICPKGWRLPNGGATASFFALDKALGGNGSNRTDAPQRNKFITAPYSFPYSGYYHYGGNGLVDQGTRGRWWSRSSYTVAGQAYYFNLSTSGSVAPQYGLYVGYGFAVRCVVK